MTESDLRMLYKRDTGLDVDFTRDEEIYLNGELTIEELQDPVEHSFDVNMNDIPYVQWLEEELLKFKNLKK